MLGQLYMAIFKNEGDRESQFANARSQIRSQIEQVLEEIKSENESAACLPIRTEVIVAPNKLATAIRLEKVIGKIKDRLKFYHYSFSRGTNRRRD